MYSQRVLLVTDVPSGREAVKVTVSTGVVHVFSQLNRCSGAAATCTR